MGYRRACPRVRSTVTGGYLRGGRRPRPGRRGRASCGRSSSRCSRNRQSEEHAWVASQLGSVAERYRAVTAAREQVNWRRARAFTVAYMISLFQYETPPGPCGYLDGQTWRYQHEVVAALTPAEYQERLEGGWRRFGHLLFRPACPACAACRSLRVDVARFRPNRSQRRNRRLNQDAVLLTFGRPVLTREKLDLYDRY